MKKAMFLTALLIGLTGAARAADSKPKATAPKTSKSAVATVNDTAITADDLTKRLWWQHAAKGLSDLIDERLLLEEAARLKIKVDEKEVTAKIDQLRANYKDKEEFDKSLKSVNWSEKDLKTLIENQLLVRNTAVATGKIAVTDENAKDFYQKNKERFNTPESAKLLQIFVNTKAEADDAYMALAAGADFAKLATLKSTDANLKKNGGSLGYIAKGMLQPELEKEVFSLKPGEYTKPLATGNGFSILKLEELKPPQEVSYETAKDDLKTALVNQAIAQELPRLLGELRAKAKIELTAATAK